MALSKPDHPLARVRPASAADAPAVALIYNHYVVAHFQGTGFKFGRWIDVGYWELML